MFSKSLLHEVSRFDRSLPIERALTPPSSWYIDTTFEQAEMQAVLFRSWQPLARLDQLTRPGDYVTGQFGGEPYLIARGEDGALRAFYNVCRHHAAVVAQGEGCAQEFVCPYHGWTYRNDGRLRRAPRLGAVECFNRAEYGLKEIALKEWGLWAWLRFEPQNEPGADDLDLALKSLARLNLDGLRFSVRKTYEIGCNWKVFVDNYLDGGYHVEYAHPGLASKLDLSLYKTEVLPRLVVQTCDASPADLEGPDFAERLEGGAFYAWLYPNFMWNRYGPILDTNHVIPLGPDRCLTVFDYFFEESCDAEFIERSLAASHQVQLEDVALCETVQRGLRSAGYDVGRYAPSVEMGEYRFHHWLAEDLSSLQPAQEDR
jgi:choline monooxygenase